MWNLVITKVQLSVFQKGEQMTNLQKLESSLAYHLSQNAWVPYSSQTSALEFQQEFKKFIAQTP